MITQLREEVEALKKQCAAKEQAILDRDKKVSVSPTLVTNGFCEMRFQNACLC